MRKPKTADTPEGIVRKRSDRKVSWKKIDNTRDGYDPSKRKVIHDAMIRKIATNQMEDQFNLEYGLASDSAEVPATMCPPFNFNVLIHMVDDSKELRQCIDSIVVNAYGYGQRLAYEGPDGQEQSQEAIAEKNKLQALLDYPNDEYSLSEMKRRLGFDKYAFGNWYMEILRDRDGNPESYYHIPAHTMRITLLDQNPVKVKTQILVGGELVTKTRVRYFRRYVQLLNGKKRYFKEFEDPRPVDPDTGRVDTSLSFDQQASEVIHRKIYHPRHVYGVPPWVSQYPSVLGSREAELVNLDFFKENTIPAMALLVAGGYLTADAIDEIEERFVSGKGRGAMHRLLVLEATGDENAASTDGRVPIPSIEIRPLADQRQKDALFLEYNKMCETSIRSSMRIPPIFVGKSDTYNYACYDEETETLTDHGWIRYDEYHPGMKIAQFDPITNLAKFVDPIGDILVYDFDGEMVQYSNQIVDMRVTPNHRMYFRTEEGKYRIEPAEETMQYDNIITRISPDGFEEVKVLPLICDGKESQIMNAQIEMVHYTGKVYCFSVPTGLMITRRNGKIAIQGNTAQTSFLVGDSQVFGPERADMDDVFNYKIFKSFRPRFWKFRSVPPRVVGTVDTIRALKALNDMGGITPNLAIQFASELFNTNFPAIKQPWGDVPFNIVLEMVRKGAINQFEELEKEKLDQTVGETPEEQDRFMNRVKTTAEESGMEYVVDPLQRLVSLRNELNGGTNGNGTDKES